MHEFYPTALRQQYRLLKHKGHYSQVHLLAANESQWAPKVEEFKRKYGRDPNDKEFNSLKTLDRRLLNGEEKVIAWAKEWNGKGNLFVGRNPRSSTGDALHCTALSLDLDPVRPKEAAASEIQHLSAIKAGQHIRASFGFGVVSSSGNGCLLLFPLREAVTKEVAERWGRAIEEYARKLIGLEDNLNVRVDSTFDAPRLCKCLGTISTKGDPSLWRHAKFISDPHDPGNPTKFYDWLDAVPKEAPKDVFPASLSNGELDRSKADFAFVCSLKSRGFGPDDAYKAFRSFAAKSGREERYYENTFKKAYYGLSEVVSGRSGVLERSIDLITPQSGILGYRSRSSTGVPELPTGFAAIDKATFGLTRGTIFTVGARRGAGKTTFAVGAALNICRAGKRVLFLSTETTYTEVWDRYVASGTGTSAFALQHSLKLNGHQRDVDSFMQEFTDRHSFTVYDGSRPSAGLVRRIVEQSAPDVLIFDYFQHVEARDVKALEEFVMDLNDLAKEKQFAVLMCAQLHDRRNPQTNKPYPPTLNDMKNSKVLNDESRVVLLLDWDSEGAKGDGPAAVKCVMAKNRGPKVDVLLKLDRSIPRFTEEGI